MENERKAPVGCTTMIVGTLLSVLAVLFLFTGSVGKKELHLTREGNPFGYWFAIALLFAVGVFVAVAGWRILRGEWR